MVVFFIVVCLNECVNGIIYFGVFLVGLENRV